MGSELEIREIKSTGEVTADLVAGLAKLLPQVSGGEFRPDETYIKSLIDSGASAIFVAEESGIIVGTLTLVLYSIPTGKKARIEDVVVDASSRGKGIGEKLNLAAIQRAKEWGAGAVDLTSKPERKAANELYKKLGFEIRETNVYRKPLG